MNGTSYFQMEHLGDGRGFACALVALLHVQCDDADAASLWIDSEEDLL